MRVPYDSYDNYTATDSTNSPKANDSTSNDSSVHNSKVRDNGAKLVFGDPILCAQFLRGYTGLEILKDVQPEDLEDISERFLPLWQEGRDSDTVKKIHLKDFDMYLIALIEHQSSIHYDMSFRILRYIVMILTYYAEDQEKLQKGITKSKDFKYPPILPIVYYEGSGEWTAVKDFKDRVHLSDIFAEFIPSFQYMVFPLNSYSNRELIDKQDELSLIFLINKLRNSADFHTLKEIPSEYFENLSENTPEYLLGLIGKIIAVLLTKLNIPKSEVEELTEQIERRDFQMMFDCFEGYDVQETRRVSREEGIAVGRSEGIAVGRTEGETLMLISKVCKKIQKHLTVPEIADIFEEDTSRIQRIYDIAVTFAPDYDTEAIFKKLQETNNSN